ncbi:phage holin, lambda family [Pseudomonas typographi]|uniref:Phage holin, lambda family n=1 Tax=Pseudomonas typographi TaxID=2715964 RepID=A0ABR7ZAY4_9PSED|nr:phage holin, lambda family [Pseudomonas typographi]MBD1555205.1 phage holin, lambda family [Pseudomonas typographi]MBD1589268.1 phage holin, lambda family [Pseudomonas typographi]MBD1602443.1 phage holin, lambda family [Pseudomonas typographi]
MPEKPEFWLPILAWVAQHTTPIYAFGLSIFMAVVRTFYSGGSWRQATFEGALCGGLTLTLLSGLELFGFPTSMASFVGGWVGFLGVKKISALANRYAEARLPHGRP